MTYPLSMELSTFLVGYQQRSLVLITKESLFLYTKSNLFGWQNLGLSIVTSLELDLSPTKVTGKRDRSFLRGDFELTLAVRTSVDPLRGLL